MLDKSNETLISGLSRALADPSIDLLHGTRQQPGLFPASASGRKAAQHCKDEGLVQVVSTEKKGKTTLEHCTLTKKGARYLLMNADPQRILEDFVRAIEAREEQLDSLLTLASGLHNQIHQLGQSAQAFLDHLQRGPRSQEPDLAQIVLHCLGQWRQQGNAEDCPLPELFQQARRHCPELSQGQFHDALRKLHQHQQIYLHPWTGPLYEMPEPGFALLIGHEIAYYSSIRSQTSMQQGAR